MTLKRFLPTALLVSVASVLAQTPPPARQVMARAEADAAAQHKKIFLIFHASWCGWCRQLDKFIETPKNKAIFDKYFAFVHLTVQERESKAVLNNPGGEEVLAALGGKDTGLPFFAFLEPSGTMIVNSMRPVPGTAKRDNVGYPAAPEEIDWFMAMLKKAVPAMTAGETATLETWLRTNEKR